MTASSHDSLYWTDVYLKGQEEFLRRWNDLAQAARSAGDAASGNGPAPASGADWFASFAPFFAGPSADVARRYFGLYDQYLGATRALSDVLTRALNESDPQARARAFAEGAQSLRGTFAQLWTAMLSGAQGAAPDAAAVSGQDWMQALARAFGAGEAPALGLTRERQQSLQKLQQLTVQYLEQHARLAAQWNDVIGEALQILGERVGAKLRAGATIESARVLYDLWVESAELAYAKAAHSPEYAKAQADLGNTLAKLRSAQREQVEVWTKQIDLPTREELNTVHRRIKDLKTELRRLTERLEAAQHAPRARQRTPGTAPRATPRASARATPAAPRRKSPGRGKER